MTVEDRGVIDSAYFRADEFVLVISDHLPWEDAREHLFTLQEKTNDYLAFIESGQAAELGHNAKKYAIRMIFKHQPPAVFDDFIAAIEAAVVGKLPVRVFWDWLPTDE